METFKTFTKNHNAQLKVGILTLMLGASAFTAVSFADSQPAASIESPVVSVSPEAVAPAETPISTPEPSVEPSVSPSPTPSLVGEPAPTMPFKTVVEATPTASPEPIPTMTPEATPAPAVCPSTIPNCVIHMVNPIN